MTSLLTNTSAMVALQTLRSINSNLEQTNNRVSTGLRVNTAADNAAYWSISTTIKSDNGALGAVTDSLSLGASTLTTTYNGLNAAITALNDLKNQLTTATGANVDKAKVQQTISADQAQLYAVAKSSSFSGQNWLYTGSSTATSSSIVSSVSRDSNNDLTIGTIDVGSRQYPALRRCPDHHERCRRRHPERHPRQHDRPDHLHVRQRHAGDGAERGHRFRH